MSLGSLRLSHLGLRSHERKSHAAFQEVQFDQFTGNALLFLHKKQGGGSRQESMRERQRQRQRQRERQRERETEIVSERERDRFRMKGARRQKCAAAEFSPDKSMIEAIRHGAHVFQHTYARTNTSVYTYTHTHTHPKTDTHTHTHFL